MHRLAQFSMRQRALVALVTVVIAALGVVSLGSLRQELLPSVELPGAAVVGVYPGSSPEVVEQQVTAVVEAAVLGVQGVETVQSTSASDVSVTTVLFRYGTDMNRALQDLRRAVDQVDGRLPGSVDPEIVAGSIDDLPVVQLAAAGGADADALTAVVEDLLVPRLERLEGVRSVTVSGRAEREIRVDVAMPALLAAGLTPDQVLGVLDDHGVRLPAGTVTDGEQTLAVQVGTPIGSVAELEALPLTSEAGAVTLGDVADVVDAEAAARSLSRLDGEPALGVAITKRPDANTVETSDAVRGVVDDVLPSLEAQDVRVAVVFDQAPFITESIDGLATEGLLGLVFAIVVILLFLASVRSTLVSAVSIPLSLLTAFTVMLATGYTLNLLTLAALTISIGRVVDDSIVVIENIKRHLSYGEPRREAVLAGVGEVATAITSATVATVAVFVPIGLVGGIVGELFRPFAFTVAIAMGASLFVALTIVPVLAYWFVKAPEGADDPAVAERVRAEAEAKERRGPWQRAFVPSLAAAVRHPVVTLLVAVGVFGGTLAFVPRLETTLLGDAGQDTLTVTQSFEPGTSLEAQDAAARDVEDALAALAEVETVQTSVGAGDAFTAAFTAGRTQATFAVTLDPDVDGVAARDTVREALTGLVEPPVTEIQVSAGDAAFGSSTVDLVVTSDDPAVLADATRLVRDAVEDVDGVAAVTDNLAAAQPVVQVTVDRGAAAAAGLTETAVAGTVAALMNPAEIGTVDLGDGPVTVRAVLAQAPATVEELRAVPVTGTAGPVPLGQVAAVDVVEAPASITREDGRRTVTVAVTPAGQDTGGLAAALTAELDALELPVGADVEVAGLAADQAETFADLGLALLVAVVIVYVVMVATFNSLVQPLILMVSVPFASTGALAALLLTGTALDASALIGLLMLVGVVVTNAIVLIDRINQFRAAGRPLADAVAEGARQRLRPIVMTAAATIFALLPMAIGITGGGAFISRPLALVVIGGLVTSTFLTLILVPVLYTLQQRWVDRRASRRAARREGRRAARRARGAHAA